MKENKAYVLEKLRHVDFNKSKRQTHEVKILFLAFEEIKNHAINNFVLYISSKIIGNFDTQVITVPYTGPLLSFYPNGAVTTRAQSPSCLATTYAPTAHDFERE